MTDHIINIDQVVNVNKSTTSTNKNSGLAAKDLLTLNKLAQAITSLVVSNKQENSLLNEIAKSFGNKGYSDSDGFKDEFTGAFRRELEAAFAKLRNSGESTSSAQGKDIVDSVIKKSLSEALRDVSGRAKEKGVNIPTELINALDKKIQSSPSILPKETHSIINEMYSASKSMSSTAFKVLQTMEKMGELSKSGGSLDLKEFLVFGKLLKETVSELAGLKKQFANIFSHARTLKESHGVDTSGFIESAKGFKKSIFSKTGAMSRSVMNAPATVTIDMASMISDAVKKAVPQLADSKQIKTIDKLIEKSAPYTEVITAVEKLINELRNIPSSQSIDISSLQKVILELSKLTGTQNKQKEVVDQKQITHEPQKHTILPKLSESYSKKEEALNKVIINFKSVVDSIDNISSVDTPKSTSVHKKVKSLPKRIKKSKTEESSISDSNNYNESMYEDSSVKQQKSYTSVTGPKPPSGAWTSKDKGKTWQPLTESKPPKINITPQGSSDDKLSWDFLPKSDFEDIKKLVSEYEHNEGKKKSASPTKDDSVYVSKDDFEQLNDLVVKIIDYINSKDDNTNIGNVKDLKRVLMSPEYSKGLKLPDGVGSNEDIEGFRAVINAIYSLYDTPLSSKMDKQLEPMIREIREILSSNNSDELKNRFNSLAQTKKDISSFSHGSTGNTYGKDTNLRSYKKGKKEEFSYEEKVISPSNKSDFSKDKIENLPSAEIQRLIVEKNADDLAKSLADLQKFMIERVASGLEESKAGWSIVRETADQNIAEYFSLVGGMNKKKSGKQFSFKIADIKGLQSSLGGKNRLMNEFGMNDVSMNNPVALIEKYKEDLFNKTMSRSGHRLPEIMAKWTKTMSKETISDVSGIDRITKKKLLGIKERFSGEEGTEPSQEFVSEIRSLDSDGLLKNLYKSTVNDLLANEYLTKGTPDSKQRPLVRELALPAARMSESGAMVFDTQQGSQRVIPKFATYKTGFESMIDELTSVGKFDVAKHSVKKLGIRPKDRDHELVRNIAEQMLIDWSSPKDDEKIPEVRNKIVEQYKKAAVIRSKRLEEIGQIPEGSSRDRISKIHSELDTGIGQGFKAGDVGIDELMKKMNELGVDAADLAKSMEKIEFKNIYDVIKQLLNVPGKNKNVLDKLSKEPYFEANIRDFETLLNKLVGTVPIADKSKPRRYAHQEKIINLMSLSTPTYGAGVDTDADEQKKFIRDLNLNLKDFMENQKELRKYGMELSGIPKDITTISSLGVPETQASKLNEYRPSGKFDDVALSELNSTSIKMYTDSLAELAPFGKQFQQLGRNIASTTGAKAYRPGDGIIGTETPSLRSSREHELIVAGRHGDQGYGFNVMAELRNTASTFEDQIVISGKLADVLTQHVKTMVQPDKLGRVGFFNEDGQIKRPGVGEVGDIKVDHKLAGFEDANKIFQEVLGVKQEYRGRADKALIQEVEKAITVVRGEPLNVQIAKVVETFFNYYGRKFTTRYGSKGVSVLASGAPEMTGKELGELIQNKKVEIIPEEEREKAGLGTAIMPKSMGKLLSEVFESKGDTSLSKELVESGNKFILSMFTDANLGVVPEYEAEAQQILFNKVKEALSGMNIDIKKDVEGIAQIKDLYSKQVPGGLPNIERPIDIRFSSYGIAKRGLQTENLEAIMNNVISSGGQGKTVLNTEFDPKTYKRMLGTEGTGKDPLNLSYISSALGFERQEDNIDTIEKEILSKLKLKEGDKSTPAELESKAKKLASLEYRSNFYSNIVDEFGKQRKSLVGPKFVEITEDPHEYSEWSSTDIEKQIKGERLNLPAFGAYSAIFGESSKLLDEVAKDVPIESKKHWEYIKVLQTINGSRKDMAEKLLSSAKKVDVAELYGFTASTGHFEDNYELKEDRYGNVKKIRDPRSFKDTLLDYEKYPGALSLQIPSTIDPKKREDLYVPSSIGRTVYPEPTMAGEYGLDIISRRLNRVVVAAKELDQASSGAPLNEDDKFDTIGRIKKKVSDLRSSARNITKDNKTGKYVENIGDVGELQLNEILQPMLDVLSKYKVNPAYDSSDMSRADYIMKFKNKKMGEGKSISEVYQTTIDQAADQLLGQLTPPPEGASQILKDRYNAPGALNIASDVGPAQVGEIAKAFGVDQKYGDKYIQSKIKSLEKAKIEYYNAIATTILGKTGSIQELAFTRKIPAVMAKAVTAVVDKTSEFEEFKNTIDDILSEDSYGIGEEFDKLRSISEEIGNIGKGHAKSIEEHKKKGIPVLKQHEIGVPDVYAEKLPVQFTKRYSVNKEKDKLSPLSKPLKVDSNLKEMLEYRDELLSLVDKVKDGTEKQKLGIHLRDELTPYIESVRYPFTGISSVQPYEAKLLKPEKGERHLAKHSLTAPGIPELDFDAFDKNKKEIDSIIKSLTTKVDEEYKKPEPDVLKIDSLLSVIKQLENALSGLIPKYIAQQQKLDFDGDQIEIHSAKTAEARKEIEKHFKYIHSPSAKSGPTSKMFRDEFTYGAMVGSTGKYTMAEQQLAFSKKFPEEEGFGFMTKPFLTEKLEYLSPKERLDILAKTPDSAGTPKGAFNAITDIIPSVYRNPKSIDKIFEALSSVEKPKDSEGNIDESKYSEALLQELEGLGGNIAEVINSGIKEELFNTKYLSTINAQLFKINTGPDTESTNRLLKIHERSIGVGSGIINSEFGYNFSPDMAKKFPSDLNVTGNAIGEELNFMANELIRVAQQKGFDVKHAGEVPVAGEIADLLSRGEPGAKGLISKIEEGKGSYKDIKEFAESNEKALDMRLSLLSTDDILEDAKKLASGRGELYKVEGKDRDALKKYIIDAIGFKGYLKEWSNQIVLAAREALIEEAKKVKGITDDRDAEAYASKEINKQLSTGGINIGQTFEKIETPLYKYRTFTAKPKGQIGKYKEKYGDVDVPELSGIIEPKTKDFDDPDRKLIYKYKFAKAISQNLYDDISSFSNTDKERKDTYSKMVDSTISNLQNDAKVISALNKMMETEGDRMSTSVVDRLYGDAPMYSVTESVLKPEKYKDIKREVEKFARSVGAPSMTERTTRDLEFEFDHEIGKRVEEKFPTPTRDLYDTDEEFEKSLAENKATKEKEMSKMKKRAMAVAQMDIILRTAETKKGELDFLSEFAPSIGSYKPERSQIKEAISKDASDRILSSGSSGYSYDGSMADSPIGPNIPTSYGLKEMSGGPVPVFVVGVANGVGLVLGGGTSTFSSEGYLNTDQKSSPSDFGIPKSGIPKELMEKVKWAEELIGTDKSSIIGESDFGKKYRASGLKGGYAAKKVGNKFTPDKQVEEIVKNMTGEDTMTHIGMSSSLLGTAVHKKLEDKYKNEDVLSSNREKLKTFIEKPIPKFVDEIGGEFSGTMDVVREDSSGLVDHIIDIKTVSDDNFSALFDAIKAFREKTGKETPSLQEIKEFINSNEANYLKNTKLDEVASQLNLYLAATNKGAGSFAHFYSNTDPDKGPAVLSHKFDDKLLDRDMRAVASAREEIIRQGKSFGKTESQEQILNRPPEKDIPVDELNKAIDVLKEYYNMAQERRQTIGNMPSDSISDESTHISSEDLKNIRNKMESVRKDSEAMEDRFAHRPTSRPVIEGLGTIHIEKALTALHQNASRYQRSKGVDIDSEGFKKFNERIQQEILKTLEEGPRGAEFASVMSDMKDAGDIDFTEFMNAWKAYRIAVGDYYVNAIKESFGEYEGFKSEGDVAGQTKSFDKYSRLVKKFQDSVKGDLGKKTDIYTEDRMYIHPKLAEEAGVRLTTDELIKKASDPLEEDKTLKTIFNRMLDFEGEKAPIPRESIREALVDLIGIDKALIDVYTDAELVARAGEEIEKTWDFSKVSSGLSRLKDALKEQLSYDIGDRYSSEQIAYLQNVLKTLKTLEKVWINVNTESEKYSNPTGEKIRPTLIPPSKELSVEEQQALHLRNISNLERYFATPESKGGASAGEQFVYDKKVFEPSGKVVENQKESFIKYGDVIRGTGEEVSSFTRRHKDLLKSMTEGNRTFSVAIDRVIKWGAAASLVYGGLNYVKKSIDQISDIEVAMAQIQMVMNPVDTNFNTLQTSSVDLAKQYGVPVTGVLEGMRTFAQQGLSQEEVLDRTKTSVLASNITTLNSTDATEALTAAMKVFKEEGQESIRFLDSWSNVESKAAVTSGNLADAIKKSASAAKNAGFTFDQLNGIVTAIGSVTRQTGKEVGTSLRFIMRRLGTDAGPKELSKVGVNILGEEGGMRSGFDILDDLSKKWGDLSRAQKMAIAQGLGGTRQYNQVLVLMDNWSEALRNVKNSMDSKGSAERRNLILMKTYSKQLEQTKAMFSELKIEMGKLVLPSFKMGLSGIRGVLSVVNSIPSEFKLAAAGAAAFFAYVSKGQSILSDLIQIVDKGKIAFSGLGKEFSKGIKVGGYELLGIGEESDPDLFGLNSMQKGAGFNDLESSLGKLGYSLLSFGRYYNKFLGLTASDTGKPIKAVGSFVESIGNNISKLTTAGAFSGNIPVKMASTAAEMFVASPLEYLGKATKGAGSGIESLGTSLVENLGSDHASILKSMGPLLGTGIGLGIMAPKAFSSIKDFIGSAKDLKDSKAGIIDANKKEIDGLEELINKYNELGTAQEKLKKLQDPEEINRLKDIREYESPMFFAADLEKRDKEFQKSVAKYAPSLIGGVTEYGDIQLDRSNEAAVRYIKNLANIRKYQEAMVESDIAVRFSEDLTKTDGNQNVKYIMSEVAKSVPLIGEMLEKGISVGPKKALSEFTKELNKVIMAKSDNPLTNSFDPILNGMYDQLEGIKEAFDDINGEFKKILDSIDTRGLKPNQIESIFNREELLPGYDVMAATDEIYKGAGVTGKQIMQSDIFKSVIANDEKVGQYIYNMVAPVGDITSERFQEAQMSTRPVIDDVATIKTGDFVTVTDKFAEQYRIAGQQAIVEIDESNRIFLKYVDSISGEFVKALMYSGGQSNVLDNSIKNIYPTDEIIRKAEEHRTKLATFITGAESGIVGLDKENLNKRNLDLGTRFFSEIDTGTLLQTEKGYDPINSSFVNPDMGTAPTNWYKSGWAEDYDKYIKDPMKQYSTIMESVRGGGADSSDYLIGEDAERIAKLQGVIQNNSVVFQFRQEMENLNKTLESSARNVKNLIDAEKQRNKVYVETYGFTKGAPKDLTPPDLGVRSFEELNPHQISMNRSPIYADVAQKISSMEQEVKGLLTQQDALIQARSNINDMGVAQTAFGAVNIDNIKNEEDLKKYLTEVQEQSGFTKSEALIASHLDEINKSTKDGTNEAQETNKLLSELVSFFTGASTREKFEEKKSSLMDINPEEFYTKEGLFSRSNSKLNKFNQEVIGLQTLSEKASEEGNIKLMREIDSVISDRTGALLSNGVDFLVGRNEKSTDTKKLFTAFSKGISSAGVPLESLIDAFERSETGSSKKGKKVVDSLRKSMEEGKAGYSEGFFSSGNIANTAAVAYTFSKVKDLISGASVANIDKTIEGLVTKKANLPEGASSDIIDRDISVLTGLREKKTSMRGVYETVGGLAKTAIATHGSGSIAGMDEDNIRNFMVLSSGLYLAFKALKGNVDKLPKSFEEVDKKISDVDFEKITKGIVDGKPLNSASKKLAKALSVFVKDLDEEMKSEGYSPGDGSGIKDETLRRTEQLKDIANKKDLKELEAQFEKQISAGNNGSIRAIQALIATLTLTTAQNYLDNKQEIDRQISFAEDTGSEQQKNLYYILQNEPGVVKSFMEAAAVGNEKAQDSSKTLEPLVLSQADERSKYVDQINEYLSSIGEKIEKFSGTLNELKSFASAVQSLSDTIKSLQSIQLEHVKAMKSIDITSMYGFPMSAGDTLRGFPGEVRVLPTERELGPQQRLFSESSDEFKSFFTTYYKLQKAYETKFNALMTTETDLSEAKFNFNYLKDNDLLTEEDEESRLSVINSLKNASESGKISVEKLRKSLVDLDSGFQKLSTFSSYIYELKNSLEDLVSINLSDSAIGTKSYRTALDKMLGGSHPLAAVSISPEQERMGNRVGVRLVSGESNAMDVERVEILDRMRTATGEEARELGLRLQELPDKYGNLVYAKEQMDQNRKFQESQAPYEKLQQNLFGLIGSGKLTTDEEYREVRGLISLINSELNKSTRVVSAEEKMKEVEDQYISGKISEQDYITTMDFIKNSGFDKYRAGVDTNVIDSAIANMSDKLKGFLPDVDEKSAMYDAIANPIVSQLETANKYLSIISSFYSSKGQSFSDPAERAIWSDEERKSYSFDPSYVRERGSEKKYYPGSRTGYVEEQNINNEESTKSNGDINSIYSKLKWFFMDRKLPSGTGYKDFYNYKPIDGTVPQELYVKDSLGNKSLGTTDGYYTSPNTYIGEYIGETLSFIKTGLKDFFGLSDDIPKEYSNSQFIKIGPVLKDMFSPLQEFFNNTKQKLKVEDKVFKVEDKVFKVEYKPVEDVKKERVDVINQNRASGGRIFGAGGPREDKVPAYLSPGEFVIRAHTAQKLGYNTLDHINKKGEIPTFASGGLVGDDIYERFMRSKYVLSDEYALTRAREGLPTLFERFAISEMNANKEITLQDLIKQNKPNIKTPELQNHDNYKQKDKAFISDINKTNSVAEIPYVLTTDNIYDRFMDSKYVKSREYELTRSREGLPALFEKFAISEMNANKERLDEVIRIAALGGSSISTVRSFKGDQSGVKEVSGRYIDRNNGSNITSNNDINKGGIRSFVGDASGVFEVSEKGFDVRDYQGEGNTDEWLKKLEEFNKVKPSYYGDDPHDKDAVGRFDRRTGFYIYTDPVTGKKSGKARKSYYEPSGPPFMLSKKVKSPVDTSVPAQHAYSPNIAMPNTIDFSEPLPIDKMYDRDYSRYHTRGVIISRYVDKLKERINKAKSVDEIKQLESSLGVQEEALKNVSQVLTMIQNGESIYTSKKLTKEVLVDDASAIGTQIVGSDGKVHRLGMHKYTPKNPQHEAAVSGDSYSTDYVPLSDGTYINSFAKKVQYKSVLHEINEAAKLADAALYSDRVGDGKVNNRGVVGVLPNMATGKTTEDPVLANILSNERKESILDDKRFGVSGGSEALMRNFLPNKEESSPLWINMMSQMIRQIFESLQNNGSMPVYHHGGYIDKTGPVFAQKGEFIIPKFAPGGVVPNIINNAGSSTSYNGSLVTETLKNVSLDVNLNKLRDIELKIEDKKLQVEDKKLQVEETTLKVDNTPLKVDNTPLKVEEKTFKVEDKVFSVEDKTLKVDSTPLRVEDKVFSVEDRVLKVDNTPLKVDNTPLKVEEKTFKVEDKVFSVEDKTLKVDSTPLRVEDKTFRVEDRVLRVENKILQVDRTPITVNSAGASARDSIAEAMVRIDSKFMSAMAKVDNKVNVLRLDLENKIKSTIDEKVSGRVSILADQVGSLEYRLNDLNNNVTSSISRLAGEAASIRALANTSLNFVGKMERL